MLKSILHSLPFLVFRTLLVCVEGLVLVLCCFMIKDWFLDFVSQYVPQLFLFFLTPMAYIVGLAIGAAIIKYVFGLIQYYFKLAQIIYLTTLILNYKPFIGSRFVYSMGQAATNFTSLALNDFTTRSIVSALKSLKNAILNNDLMSRFTEPKSTTTKFVKLVCSTALGNVINMTDEMMVSYTWFTYDLYLANCKQKGKEPSVKQQLKNRASFMLEGLVFIVRTFPNLLVNSVVVEVGFIIISNAVTIGIIGLTMFYFGFSFMFIFIAIILYRTLIQIFYYTFVESLRLTFYLHSFYSELEELEPFDITESVASLLGKVPLLKSLVKQSGQKIQATGSEGDHILEGNINDILVKNVKEVAEAFNLDTKDVIKSEEDEVKEPEQNEVEEIFDEEPEDTKEDKRPQQESENIEVVLEEDIELDIESEPDTTNGNPFNNANRVTRRRG